MLTIALRVKTVFFREKQRHLEQALSLLQEAAAAILLALFGVLFCITLLSVLQNKTIHWLSLLDIIDELAFLSGALMLPCLLLALLKYHYWRATLFAWRVLASHFCRAGRRPPAADALPRMLQAWQQNVIQARIIAFTLQLRHRLAKRPPALWPVGKAPLGLFQRANLLLAP
ncbi:MAG: hypothetical protein CL608_11520 [Anaerolineaceae bacterium]|nr:hypothetical protein [Anaerolineaceae bacterium]